jgi:hypothetical protein
MSDTPLSRRMLLRRAALAAGSAATLGLTPSLAHAAKTPVAAVKKPDVPPAPPDDISGKNIDDIVKGFDKLTGVITLYRRENDLYAELTPSQLDTPFLLQATRETGTSGTGGIAGDPLADLLFKFHQENNQIVLVEPNLTFRAAPKTPEAISLERSFAPSNLATYQIEAIRPAADQAKAITAMTDPVAKMAALRKAAIGYLIHIPSLFQSDVPNFLGGMSGYNINAQDTYLQSVKNFSGNLVVNTSYAFSGRPMGASLFGLSVQPASSDLADSRGFVEKIAYNLFPLTETDYKPRFYDDRIGYFTQDYETFNDDVSPDNIRRMILRWHLVKKDPTAAISEPVTPILFWIDNATPERYRDAIQAGVLSWNPAFEAVGYKNAVQCQIMPDDADWDPADMSHNVVRWTSSYGAGHAVAQFRHNPMTGQMLNAAITVDASMARFTNLSYPTTFLTGEPAATSSVAGYVPTGSTAQRQLTPPELAAKIIVPKPMTVMRSKCQCNVGPGAMKAAAFGWDCVAFAEPAIPGSDPWPNLTDFTNQYLHSVVCHETGHCLGLRHNFKGSTMLNESQLQDKEMTSKYGVTSSVMDYLPANVPPLGGKRADIWTPCIGPYDKWAIAYGYTDFGSDNVAEKTALAQLANHSGEFGLAFASDEDADQLDPFVTRFDLAADPLAFRVAMTERAHYMLGSLEYRYPQPGQPYYTLTRQFIRLLNQYVENSQEVARFIGGVVTNRNHAGDIDSVLPVEPVNFASQRLALDTLCQFVLSSKSLQFTPSLLAKLEENPAPMSDELPQSYNPDQDMSILDIISRVQATGLYLLLNHDTLSRLETNEFRSGPMGSPLTVLETMQKVTGVVWSELDGHPHVIPPLRRRLQRAYVDAVVALARPGANEAIFGPAPDDDSSAFALSTLRALTPKLAVAEKLSKDPSTAAHLAETEIKIERFLHAQTVV